MLRFVLAALVLPLSAGCLEFSDDSHLDGYCYVEAYGRYQLCMDAGAPDADAALTDLDAQSIDMGMPDSGIWSDAEVPDTGTPDTGVWPDAQPIDTGMPDSGTWPDAEVPDTGVFPQRLVELRLTGGGSGRVDVGASLSCSYAAGVQRGLCLATFSATATPSLEATPDWPFHLLGWGGSCSGQNEACQLDLTQPGDRLVIATFDL